MPKAPPYEGGWTSSISSYSQSLQSHIRGLERSLEGVSAADSRLDRDRYRVCQELIATAHKQQDTESLLAYGEWLLRAENPLAVRDVMTALRMMHIGEVWHLVTEDRITACYHICKAMRRHARTANERVDESIVLFCAYLAFHDASLIPKIVILAEQGVNKVADMRELLELMKDVPVAVADGFL